MNIHFKKQNFQDLITMYKATKHHSFIKLKFKELNKVSDKELENLPESTEYFVKSTTLCLGKHNKSVDVKFLYSDSTQECTLYIDKMDMNIKRLPVFRDIYSIDYTGIDFSKALTDYDFDNFTNELSIVQECIIHNAVINAETAHKLLSTNGSILKKLDISGCSFPNLLKAVEMFGFNYNLEELILTDVSMPDIEVIDSMFQMCAKLKEVDISFLKECKNLKSINYLFADCTSLEKITGINDIDTSNCNALMGVFQNCYSLVELNLSNWRADKCDNFDSLLYNCKRLRKLDIRNLQFVTESNASDYIDFSNVFNFSDEGESPRVEVIAADIDIDKLEETERAYELFERLVRDEADYFPFKHFKASSTNIENYFELLANYIAINYEEDIEDVEDDIEQSKTKQQVVSKDNWEKEKEALKAKADMLHIDFFDLGFTFGTSSFDNGKIEVVSFMQLG